VSFAADIQNGINFIPQKALAEHISHERDSDNRRNKPVKRLVQPLQVKMGLKPEIAIWAFGIIPLAVGIPSRPAILYGTNTHLLVLATRYRIPGISSRQIFDTRVLLIHPQNLNPLLAFLSFSL